MPRTIRVSAQEIRPRVPPEKIAVPENYLPEHPFDNGAIKIRDEALLLSRTKEIVRVHRSEYYAIITHMDQEIGRILKAQEKRSG